MKVPSRWLTSLAVVVSLSPLSAGAGDTIDLDRWHLELSKAIGEEPETTADRRPAFGIYPTLGGVIGPPNWAAAQGHAYLSFTDGHRFSIYAGYGVEVGPWSDSRIITLGWGGVRPILVASKQTGFHGKFLRYRRWDDKNHGVHHGLSFGTESGVGFAALSFEIGGARSSRNHWMIVAQVALKFAVPIRIPLTHTPQPSDNHE